MKISWKFTHPQAIQDVDELLSSVEQILKNEALYNVNGCRQNETKASCIIHMTLVH